jgi:hypothetical protein
MLIGLLKFLRVEVSHPETTMIRFNAYQEHVIPECGGCVMKVVQNIEL